MGIEFMAGQGGFLYVHSDDNSWKRAGILIYREKCSSHIPENGPELNAKQPPRNSNVNVTSFLRSLKLYLTSPQQSSNGLTAPRPS